MQVLLEGETDSLSRDLWVAECLFESLRITLLAVQFSDNPLQGLIHLVRILNWLQDLIPQARNPAIPKEFLLPEKIEKWHRISESDLALGSGAESFSRVCKCGAGVVAASAGLFVGFGQIRLMKEPFPEGDAVDGWKVVRRKLNFWKSSRDR